MTTTKTTNCNGRPVLTTWQWLSVIFVIVGGLVGLDARINAAVGHLAEENNADHKTITTDINQTVSKEDMDKICKERKSDLQALNNERKRDMKALQDSIPPKWFEEMVKNNGTRITQLESDLSTMRAAVSELTAAVKSLEKSIAGEQ